MSGDTRQRILDVSAELFVEQGYDGTSLREIAELLAKLEAATGAEDWADAQAWVVDQFFTNLTFFRLIARNHGMVEEFEAAAVHMEMHERVEKAAAATASGVGEQVRMICALGAVTCFDDWAPTLLQEAPPEVLRSELIASTRRILDLPPR